MHSVSCTNKPKHTHSHKKTTTTPQPSRSKFHFISRFGKEQAGQSIHAVSSCAEGGSAAMETDVPRLQTAALIQSSRVNSWHTQTEDERWWVLLRYGKYDGGAKPRDTDDVVQVFQGSTANIYLCTVLGFGHSYQQLEYRLGLGHQRGDGVDDRSELRVRFDTWNTTETHNG